MSHPYLVSQGAANDLKEITKYTVAQWGQVQCRAYIADLEAAAEALAKGDGAFKDMSELLPGLRVTHCGKHYIFCMPQSEKPPLILVILHERMNIMARLRNRLA